MDQGDLENSGSCQSTPTSTGSNEFLSSSLPSSLESYEGLESPFPESVSAGDENTEGSQMCENTEGSQMCENTEGSQTCENTEGSQTCENTEGSQTCMSGDSLDPPPDVVPSNSVDSSPVQPRQEEKEVDPGPGSHAKRSDDLSEQEQLRNTKNMKLKDDRLPLANVTNKQTS